VVSQQMTLFPSGNAQKFVKFHHDNPHVYRALVEIAREWKAAGNTSCSIKMLYEVLRWKAGIKTYTDEVFRLNNTYTPFYSRLIAANERDLADLFDMRQQEEGNE
jgi:hypothetical protein